MDYGVSRGCETFKRSKLAENDNLTVCRIFIYIRYNHYAFSKPAVIVPLTGALIQQKGLTHFFIEVIKLLDSFVEQERLWYLISYYLGGFIWAVHCLRRIVCLFY